jgi:outer membrane protein assembly factor BamD (BamD/ComL family)
MKKKVLFFNVVLMILAIAVSSFAQGTVKNTAATIRDADLEKDAMHNLEVARHYFKQKKAYLAALQRCEEVIAGNPTFARIDEILFIAGESSLRLSEGKGKQSVKAAAAKLRDDARGYLEQLVNDYPQSPFREQAEAELKSLGGPKPTTSKP